MKIGITCYPTYGGSGVVATELGIELAQRGHEVHFITYAQPFRLSGPQPNVWYHEVEVSHYPLFDYPPYDLALATRMAEVAEIYALDLLHVHYAIPHSVSAYLAKQMMATSKHKRRLPFVTTLHGTDITLVGQDRSYLPITRFSIEQSDGVTAISKYLRERTLKEFGLGNSIQVIYNFVNCDVYRRDPEAKERRREFARDDERLLVHLSNFRPVKRVPDVIEIFDRVQKKIPAKLLLIGDGPDRSRAEWLAMEKRIHDRVHFSRQAGPRAREAADRRPDAAAQPTGVVRAGRAGGDGVRGGAHRYQRGRIARSRRARQNRIHGRGRRRGRDGALRGGPALRRWEAETNGARRTDRGARALLLHENYSAVRKVLSRGAGAGVGVNSLSG